MFLWILLSLTTTQNSCDDWGRTETNGNGGVNDDERHLRHSPVSSPTEELRKDKRRSDNSERQEKTRPRFYFVFCVWQSSVRGCRFSFVFVYFIIKVFECSLVPTSFFPIQELHYIGAETQEEGGTHCQRALVAEGDRGAEEIGQQEIVETASGCLRRWCWSNRRTGGMEGSLPSSWVEEGWLPSERKRRSRCRSLLPSAIIMNNTYATHRSQIPWRSFRRIKRGVTTLKDKRGPGLYFILCFVCGSCP